MLLDVAIGAVTAGINQPTFVALNIVIGLLWLVIAYMLYHAATTEALKPMAPHFALMLGICTCLIMLVNWYIANVGLTSTEEQKQSLADSGQAAADDERDEQELDPDLAEKLRRLPPTSNIDLTLQDAGRFDTSSLAIQPLPPSDLLLQGKNKGA